MSAFSLAGTMLKTNIKAYKLYAIVMAIAAAIYYNFAALKFNPLIVNASDMGYVVLSINMCTVVFIFFIVYFTFNSNSFLLKVRTKEIGLYQLLGVELSKIGLVMAIESIYVTAGSLAVGLGAGILLSKLFIMGYAKIAVINFVVEFAVSATAILETLFIFSLLTLLATYENYRKVSRMKLIDLINDAKKSEQEPKMMIARGVLSLLLIIGGYILSQTMMDNVNMIFIGIIVITMIIVGSNLFFSSLMPLILRMLSENKEFLYKNENITAVSNLAFRINSNNKTWAMLTIGVAASITTLTLSFVLGYYVLVQNSSTLQNYAEVSQKSSLYISALFTYFGPIIALIFFCSLGATLLFRMLGEAMADRPRYDVLFKIGMTDEQMKKTLRKQVAISMLLPSLLGFCHAAVASFLLERVMDVQVIFPFIAAVLVFAIIYVMFYVIISSSLFKMIKAED